MENLMEYLPILLPIFLIEMILVIIALIHVLRHKSFRFGNKVLWILIVVFFQIIGPILYFTLGRGEEE